MKRKNEVELPLGKTRTIDMPSVLIEIPFKEFADILKQKPTDFNKGYNEIKKRLLSTTKKEFDNYRVRAGVADKSFIRTLYLLDKDYILRVMTTEDIPSISGKKIITLSKSGSPTIVTAPISNDKIWIFDGIVRNTFLTRIEAEYSSQLVSLILEKYFLGGD